MKRTICKFVLMLTAAVWLTGVAIPAHAVPIATWTFETSIPATAGPHAPEVGSGSGTALHAGATVYSNPAGNGSAESWSSTAWAVGDYYQFQVSTVGYEDIIVSFDQTSSGTGPQDFELRYSTDGSVGTLFSSYSVLPNQVAAPGAGVWNSTTAIAAYSYSFDLSAVSAIENFATVYFRLRDASTENALGAEGTVAAAGTDRVDNFAVVGTLIPVAAVPDPGSSAILLSMPLLGLLILRRFTMQRAQRS